MRMEKFIVMDVGMVMQIKKVGGQSKLSATYFGLIAFSNSSR